MWGSFIVYLGFIVTLAGLACVVKPIRRLRITTRRRGLIVAAVGAAVAVIGLALPVSETRVSRVETRLDEFAPAWQFREVHTIRIDAPPARVFDAIKRVRADEIMFFHTLTWIRRGGRQAPESILNAGSRQSIIDVATSNGFIKLAEDAPRELVIGTLVMVPPGARGKLTPEFFKKPAPSGFALATMNFLVTAEGTTGSLVSTETRVFATSPDARRRFAAYWRTIYPGSAIIRRMWLRAIRERAMKPPEQ